ncbi:cell division protein FtsQ/DivIB [Atopobium fossor]|uniref:cell division protein FtsQ/DivIB n=1 Tax=Atopobium fossor TaxID=39487 RepID=UPI00040F2302|nr:FtsQ-type POTRA domain-containing protein [Atopobium fossor]
MAADLGRKGLKPTPRKKPTKREEKRAVKQLKKRGASPARIAAKQSMQARMQNVNVRDAAAGLNSTGTAKTAAASKGFSFSLPQLSFSPIRALIGIAVTAISLLLLLLILSQLPVFVIESIDADSTQHMDSESIAKLASVPAGTTLLNVNTSEIAQNIQKNPWAGEVHIRREFPNKLKVQVEERKASAIVLMSSGDIAWYIGDDGVWIEPFKITTSKDESATDVALRQANQLGCLLITSVPSSVTPKAASKTTDATVLAVLKYINGFSSDFSKNIVSYSAASTESISCVLSSGVEVSLGTASDITTKESVVSQLLTQYPNQITYINVRVPSKPSYRKVGAESVNPGSGGRVVNDGTGNPPSDADEAAAKAKEASENQQSKNSDDSNTSESDKNSNNG